MDTNDPPSAHSTYVVYAVAVLYPPPLFFPNYNNTLDLFYNVTFYRDEFICIISLSCLSMLHNMVASHVFRIVYIIIIEISFRATW